MPSLPLGRKKRFLIKKSYLPDKEVYFLFKQWRHFFIRKGYFFIRKEYFLIREELLTVRGVSNNSQELLFAVHVLS